MKHHLNTFQDRPISGSELLKEPYAPPLSLVDGLLQEGLLLLGGHPIIGKSWMMLDLALSVATGTPVWGHFAVPEPQPVLYISLIDGRGRIKHRLDAIRPDVKTNDHLHLLWDFPKLGEGGLEKLRGYIEDGRYRLIVIDPLIRLAAYDKGCRQILHLLADLRDLRRRAPVCLAVVMITTMPKIDRIFDNLPTSDYAPSVQWFLKYGKPIRTLYVRDDFGISRTLRLHFAGERWQYLNPDDNTRFSQTRQDVIEVLKEYGRALSISEVNRYVSRPPDRYQATKQLMYRMLQDGQLMRSSRGLYDLAP